MNQARALAAIDAARQSCVENEVELRIPPEFVIDVLINSTLAPTTVRPEFLEWAQGMIRVLPELGRDQRQALLNLTELDHS